MQYRRNRRGVQAIEFALVAPVLLAMLGGVIDFGWYFHEQALVSTITRDAVRRGAMAADTTAAVDTAEALACAELESAGLMQGGDCSTGVVATISGVAPDQLLTLSIAAPFEPLFGLVPHPDTLAQEFTMYVENQ